MYSPRNRGPRRGASHRGRSFAPAGFLRPTDDPKIMNGLKPLVLRELSIPNALPEHRNVEPMRLKPLASYNWTNESSPTIIVPGCPPIWQNKPTPFRVPRDVDTSFIDQNKFRVPRYPLLPLVAAVDHTNPDFDFASIDIITDRNNLRKLLRWVEGSIARDFRIDIQLSSASTVLFTRCEPEPVEYDSARLGYGRNFEARTTKPLVGCEKSTGHHRIITYNYGGLKLMLRFEVDACLLFDSEARYRHESAVHPQLSTRNSSEDLLAALENLSIGTDDKVDIISAGVLVPQSSLIEMTTRNMEHLKNGIDWQEYFPQLFLSQTPHHYLGMHDCGQFRRVEARALKDDILSKQQKVQQESYDKLHALLQNIRTMVIDKGDAAPLSLVYRDKTKKLEVFERFSPASSLPDLWMRRFEVRSSETLKEGSEGTTKSTETGLEPDEGLSRGTDSEENKSVVEHGLAESSEGEDSRL